MQAAATAAGEEEFMAGVAMAAAAAAQADTGVAVAGAVEADTAVAVAADTTNRLPDVGQPPTFPPSPRTTRPLSRRRPRNGGESMTLQSPEPV